MAPDLNRALIDRTVATILAHADELTTLDQAVGDGDHGINMKRGFGAVAEAADEIAALALGPALQKMGLVLVMKVGGASGPLYGSLLMSMGKAMPVEASSREDFVASFAAGIEAVKRRGKSDRGAKTMLDVLLPVLEAIEKAEGDVLNAARAAADAGLEATREMQATKGRASFLGERSIGHLDPGARSSVLLVHAVCDVLEGR